MCHPAHWLCVYFTFGDLNLTKSMNANDPTLHWIRAYMGLMIRLRPTAAYQSPTVQVVHQGLSETPVLLRSAKTNQKQEPGWSHIAGRFGLVGPKLFEIQLVLLLCQHKEPLWWLISRWLLASSESDSASRVAAEVGQVRCCPGPFGQSWEL